MKKQETCIYDIAGLFLLVIEVFIEKNFIILLLVGNFKSF